MTISQHPSTQQQQMSLGEPVATPLVSPPDDLLIGYPQVPGGYDEMLAPDGTIRPTWQRFMRGLAQIGLSGIGQRAEQARRLLRENGVTYNEFGAPQGPDRPWELDPLPLLFSQAEWEQIAAGIRQRVTLLNAVLGDLYGPQRLLKERVIPPAVVFEHPGYWFACQGLTPRGGNHLILYAGNLARQNNGQWIVLADRTQGPSGAGYAVENRIVISRTLPRDFETLHIERLAGFFMSLRETLRSVAPEHRDNPRTVLLSPGPRSSRYFEDGYLARYLGYALVEGGDLTVRGDSVYLKTLGGLLPVDVVLRRILDEDCDPLELKPDSTLGTPGLLQAARGGQLALANAAGSGFLEAPAMQAYLPNICRFLLGEELQLGCKPTSWCGDDESLRFTEANFEQLIIRRAFVHRNAPPMLVSQLSAEQKSELLTRIREKPTQYVAQTPIERSTAPSWNGRSLSPARVVLRVFATAANGEYKVLPGGLCRVSASNAPLGDSASTGQSSKDVWVLSDQPVASVTLLPRAATAVELRRSTNDLPSRVADNLFWLGRYAERSEAIVRHLRSCVVRLTNELEPTGLGELVTLVSALSDKKEHKPSAVLEMGSPDQLRDTLTAWVFDGNMPGSLAKILQGFHFGVASVRDRLSVDSWRVVNQLDLEVLFPWKAKSPRLGEVLLLLNQLLTLLTAFSGLATESMTRGPGWRFLDMGRRIERALQILGLVRRSLVVALEPQTPILESILEIADSSMTYRHRYLASLQLAPLLDLILVDETNPRAVGFQLNALSEHVAELPSDTNNPHRSPEQRIMLGAQASLRLTDVEALIYTNSVGRRERLERFVESMEDQLRLLSNSINQHYLTHTAATRQLGSVRADG